MIKTIIIDEKVLPYKIISKGNKNTYVRFKKDHIQISKSKHISNSDVVKLITNDFHKYYFKYEELKSNTPDDNEIILEEVTYRLNIIEKTRFSFTINSDNTIDVYTKQKDILKIKKRIYKEYLINMINRLELELNYVLNKNNIEEKPIIVGYFKTKFGSYNRVKDEIKLNKVLAKANIKYLYYVLIHEYAHTKVFNHSKDFYNLVHKLMPDYKYYDKNLKTLSIWI